MKPLPFLHIRTPVIWLLQTVTNLLPLQVTFDIGDLLFLSPTEIPDARTSAPHQPGRRPTNSPGRSLSSPAIFEPHPSSRPPLIKREEGSSPLSFIRFSFQPNYSPHVTSSQNYRQQNPNHRAKPKPPIRLKSRDISFAYFGRGPLHRFFTLET